MFKKKNSQLIEIQKKYDNISKIPFVTKEGLLYKLGKYMGVWKPRVFVLANEYLYYFDTREKQTPFGPPLGYFNLLDCKIEQVTNNSKRPLSFRISETKTKRHYLISSIHKQDYDSWFSLLSQIKSTYGKRVELAVLIQSVFRKNVDYRQTQEIIQSTLTIQRFYSFQRAQRKMAKVIACITKLQSLVRSFLLKRKYLRMKKEVKIIQSHFHVIKAKNRLEKELTRKKIVQELLATEKSYVNNLKLIIDIFIKPLNSLHAIEQRVLTLSEISGVFGNWEKIYKINFELLAIFESRLNSWSVYQLIGDVFISKTDSLLEYANYVTNYDHSRKLLDKLTATNVNFGHFLDAAQRDKRSKYLDISSFLIQPVQRLPRYELLLRDLIKNTSTSHPDRANLEKGVVKMREITMYINDQQKERENLAKVLQIQQELSQSLLSSSSGGAKISFASATSLIREGEVRMAKKKWNYMYLFNSQIVIVQKSPETGKQVKDVIQLDNLTLRDLDSIDPNLSNTDLLASLSASMSASTSSLESASTNSTGVFRFRLISGKNEHTFLFDTPIEKNLWLTDIAITLNRLDKK
ncbi:hypothetical protein CYY_004251 [Polysphondylium violaceum]|uniref:Pleckstrin domain-containing protein n=1 Tax=Polysphondylium violaceum TaxID=133409 RepID=A0A8J4PTL0_9MYCE|nr:hypothetical protein CYY_004251 [Polysphondylium violaceum]